MCTQSTALPRKKCGMGSPAAAAAAPASRGGGSSRGANGIGSSKVLKHVDSFHPHRGETAHVQATFRRADWCNEEDGLSVINHGPADPFPTILLPPGGSAIACPWRTEAGDCRPRPLLVTVSAVPAGLHSPESLMVILPALITAD